MFNRSLGKSTLADGGNMFSPQTLLRSPEVNGKSMSSYTPLTHARKGTKAYASVEPRHYVGGSSKREYFLNPYHNFANFDRGTKSRPVIRTQRTLKGDAEPTDRRILKDFRNASMDSNIELDRALGMETLEQGSPLDELREVREQVRKTLPPNISKELQNRILNSITDNFIRQTTFQQRNPATGASLSDPVRLATERARQGRSSVDTRQSNRAFRDSLIPQLSPFRVEPELPSRSELIFDNDMLFRNTNRLEQAPRVRAVRAMASQIAQDLIPLSSETEVIRPLTARQKQRRLRDLEEQGLIGEDGQLGEIMDVGRLLDAQGQPPLQPQTVLPDGTLVKRTATSRGGRATKGGRAGRAGRRGQGQ